MGPPTPRWGPARGSTSRLARANPPCFKLRPTTYRLPRASTPKQISALPSLPLVPNPISSLYPPHSFHFYFLFCFLSLSSHSTRRRRDHEKRSDDGPFGPICKYFYWSANISSEVKRGGCGAMSTEDEKLLKEAKKLPWEERLLHKNWKVRNDANIDLAALCDSITDPKDPRLKEFGKPRSFLIDLEFCRLGPLFRKTVADSNAPVQEKALDALIAFLRAADADAGRYAKEVCDSIVAKCLTGRPKTVEKAQTAFLLWVELEAAEVFLKKELEAELAHVSGIARPTRKIR
ncbi:hypothetical protein B296_00044836 [Ensete ventricosum]|uniref:XMAP215/Dis1/CLASP TOG domain-containing protein n=1 Tax=Ensete ventricosum TaxID=4639 RepID=A0A426Z9I2_ENSVE|nr:hypothetical protein B296_00044836 [Ensete ventricosum]